MKKSVMLFLIILSVFFASCSQSPTDNSIENMQMDIQENAATENISPQSLTIAVLGSYSCEFDKYLSFFAESNPHISINLTVEDSHDHTHDAEGNCLDEGEHDFLEETIEKLQAGELQADIILVDRNMISALTDSDIITNLEEIDSINVFYQQLDMLEIAKEISSYKKQIVGIPVNIAFSGLIINEALLHAIGADMPVANWNYNDYYALACKLKAYNETTGNQTYIMAPDRPESLYANPVFGFDTTNMFVPDFSSPNFVEYIKTAKEIDEMGLYLFPDHFDQFDSYADNVLFTPVSYIDLHYYEEAGLEDFMILPIPNILGRPPYLNAIMLCLTQNPQEPDIAKAFLAGFLNPQYQYANAFEIKLYKDTEKYDILSNYSDKTLNWIDAVTQYSVPLTLPSKVWEWVETIQLPNGNIDDATLEKWTNRLQEEVELLLR